MSRFWKRSMGLMAVIALAGCGGPVAEETEEPVMENGQALRQCSPTYPCPVGSYCDYGPYGGTSGVCRLAPIE
jgi:hypothetical protein